MPIAKSSGSYGGYSVKYRSFLIKYAEIGVKGKNRYLFEDALVRQIKFSLKDVEGEFDVRRADGRIYVNALSDYDYDEVIESLTRVFGIVGICPVVQIEDNGFDDLANQVINYLDKAYKNKNLTFKVNARRTRKNYPMNSMELNAELGGKILEAFEGLKVDVHNPDYLLHIEIRKDYTYIYHKEIKASGGYPVSVAGRGLLMLSGGIDSPVAGYLAMKRGIKIECVYFESPPHTSVMAKNKVKKLVEELTKYDSSITLNVVKFTALQEAIYKNIDPTYMITIMRRMMYRISEKIMEKTSCLCLINGESVGQVASQTLTSMRVINSVTNVPVIRPVACLDKLEIIDISRKIGTYETSILPYEDCCTIFLPKHPVINPNMDKAILYEKSFDFNSLIDEAVNSREVIEIKRNNTKFDI